MFGRKYKRQERGRPLSAAKINQLAEAAEWGAKLSVAPPLGMQSNPTGTHIYSQRPMPVMARLSGSTSPYSWVEVYSSAPGTWTTLPGGRSGSANAYELNNKSSCREVVELTPIGNWHAFQWIGDASPPPCETGRICVTVQATGCTLDLTGVTVTIADGTSPPNVIVTGTTSGSPSKFCFAIPSAGAYRVTSHVPGVADQTATINATCGIDNNVTLTYPANSVGRICMSFSACNTTGSTSVEAPYTGTDASGTTISGLSGCQIVKPGFYEITVSYGGSDPFTSFVSVPACGTGTLTLNWVTEFWFQVRVLNNPKNYGCSGTYTMWKGEVGGPVLATSTVTIRSAPEPSGILLSDPITITLSEPLLSVIGAVEIYDNFAWPELIFGYGYSMYIDCPPTTFVPIADLRSSDGTGFVFCR